MYKSRIYKTFGAALLFMVSFFVEARLSVILISIGLTLSTYDILLASINRISKLNIFHDDLFILIISFILFCTQRYQESLAFVLIYFLGRLLIDNTIIKISKRIFTNIDSEFPKANLVKDNEVIKVDPESLKAGDTVVVYKNEMIPCDGVIIKGKSKLNTFDLTGQKEAVDVKVGDKVFNETTNIGSTLTIKLNKTFDESASAVISRTLKSITEDSKYLSRIRRFSNLFTLSFFIVFISLLILVYYLTKDLDYFLYFSLALALIISPMPVVDTIKFNYYLSVSKLIKRGVLIKQSNTLDEILKIDTILFDKSSTLTKGDFKITKVYSPEMTKDEVLKTLAICEEKSKHELAMFIKSKYGSDKKLSSNYREYSGGIKVNIDKDKYILGNLEFMKRNKIKVKKAKAVGSVIYMAKNNKFIAYIVIKDEVKKGVSKTIRNLESLGIKDLIIVSSDNFDYVKEICDKLKLKRYISDLSKQEKLTYMDKAQKEGSKIMFIGEGVKDEALLAKANLGVAIGDMGEYLSLKNSDMIILNNDLSHIELSIKTAKENRQMIFKNLIIAFSFKLILFLLLVLGIFNLGLALIVNTSIYLMSLLNSYTLIKEKTD